MGNDVTGPNPELDDYLNWVAQQGDFNRTGYYRLGVYPHNPQMLVLHFQVSDPTPGNSYGQWTHSFLEHHNAVMLAAQLLWQAYQLQRAAGVTEEKAYQDTWELFKKCSVEAALHANREAQP